MCNPSAQPGWHGLELRHLAALRAVAHERSFSAAAASLGYTQSAVSGQIIALERVVGARLLERIRGSRLVEVTEEGAVLLAHATAIAARLDAARAELAMLRAGARPTLRIGTFQTVSRTIVADVLHQLSAEHRTLDVSLRESNETGSLLDQLERGKLDLAFTLLPLREGPFEALELYRDEHVLVVRRSDPLAARGAVTLDELADTQLIRLAAGRTTPGDAIWIEDIASLTAFVSAGLGVGVIPARTAALPPDLTSVALDAPTALHVVGLAWHRDRALGLQARRFVDLVASAAAAPATRPLLRAI
jgi:DNA-binding transcriptional LysR family regulator